MRQYTYAEWYDRMASALDMMQRTGKVFRQGVVREAALKAVSIQQAGVPVFISDIVKVFEENVVAKQTEWRTEPMPVECVYG